MLADIDQIALDSACAAMQSQGIDCASVTCDVTSEEALRAAAEATIKQFGKVHMLINNAGVLVVGGVGDNSMDTWRWALNVNVMGVVCGVEVFLPLIRSHGEGGHILNTASVGGHVGFGGVHAYCTSKHAVIGYTESLAVQLQGENIGVSALCPGFTNTRIGEMDRFVDNREGNVGQDMGFIEAVQSGMSPQVVAQFALEQVQQDVLYIFTHPRTRDEVEARWDAISAAFDAAESSDIISSDPDGNRMAHSDHMEELFRVS